MHKITTQFILLYTDIIILKKLQTSPDKEFIDWKFFETLFKLDTQHPGNARACPKLSKRHIELDNTSKMRVRLATQVLFFSMFGHCKNT